MECWHLFHRARRRCQHEDRRSVWIGIEDRSQTRSRMTARLDHCLMTIQSPPSPLHHASQPITASQLQHNIYQTFTGFQKHIFGVLGGLLLYIGSRRLHTVCRGFKIEGTAKTPGGLKSRAEDKGKESNNFLHFTVK